MSEGRGKTCFTLPSEEEKQACLQWVAVGRGSNMKRYTG